MPNLKIGGELVAPNAPQPSREFCSIVVTGTMNPAIHHPSWYQSIQLLDQAAFDAAVAAPMVMVPQFSQFSTPDFSIICLPDRWEIQTGKFSNAATILAAASKVFKVLDQTPVGAYGFNFQFHKESSVENVGKSLSLAVERLPLKLNLSGEVTGQFIVVSNDTGSKKTISVSNSPLGPRLVFVGVNFHYTIDPTKYPSHFDLAPMLNSRFSVDEAEAQGFAKSVVNGLLKIGELNGSGD
jgi:hypothetical protein